jgi:hypothetical protein
MAKTIEKKEPNIRKDYKPSDDQYEVLKYVYRRKQEMGDKRAEWEPKWEKWMKQYECYRPPKDSNDWTSDIYIPMTTSTIEAMLSEIINQDLKPYAVERGVEDAPKAAVVNAILEYTWDAAKSDVAAFEIIRDAFILGTGIGQEYYWKQEREVKDLKGDKHKVVEFDNCYLEPVSLWDFYVDERARSFFGPYGAEDCIRRYIMDYDSFRAFFQGKVWDPFGVASMVKPGGDLSYYEFYKPPERLDHSREVEVLWYYNKSKDILAIVANDVLVKLGPIPYKHKQLPFARAVDIRRNHNFYGKGESEILESLQEETNTLRRMIIDRNHLDIDKPILVSDALTLEDEDMITRPHGIIPVGDVNMVKPLEYSDVAKSVFMSLELLNADKIRVTGMDERQQSVDKAGTATEAAILKEATLKRLNMKIWQLKNDFLVDVGRLRVANIMQFYSQPRLEKIVGEKGTNNYQARVDKAKASGSLVSQNGEDYEATFRNIRLKDKKLGIDPKTGMVSEEKAKGFTFFEASPDTFMPVYGGYDIRYKATSSIPISKPLKQQKTLETYDRLIQNPTIDPWKLAEMLLEEMEKDPDEFKMQKQQEQGADAMEGQNIQKLIDLAGQENSEMMNGKEIGPTPYSNPAHTEIHITFMRSEKFKEDVPPKSKILQIFTNHVQGEIMAQQARGEQGGQGGEMAQQGGEMMPQGGQSPMPNAQGGQNIEMAATMPGRAQGGGEMPAGMRGAEAGIQVGRKG